MLAVSAFTGLQMVFGDTFSERLKNLAVKCVIDHLHRRIFSRSFYRRQFHSFECSRLQFIRNEVFLIKETLQGKAMMYRDLVWKISKSIFHKEDKCPSPTTIVGGVSGMTLPQLFEKKTLNQSQVRGVFVYDDLRCHHWSLTSFRDARLQRWFLSSLCLVWFFFFLFFGKRQSGWYWKAKEGARLLNSARL